MKTRSLLLPTALVVLSAVVASHAAQLTAPVMTVSGTDRVRCIATNVGTRPGEAVITVKNLFGGGISGGSASCVPLDIGDSCILDVQATATCYFEVKGKVKASANVWDGSRIITSLPASR
jgi:hypothetical protein